MEVQNFSNKVWKIYIIMSTFCSLLYVREWLYIIWFKRRWKQLIGAGWEVIAALFASTSSWPTPTSGTKQTWPSSSSKKIFPPSAGVAKTKLIILPFRIPQAKIAVLPYLIPLSKPLPRNNRGFQYHGFSRRYNRNTALFQKCYRVLLGSFWQFFIEHFLNETSEKKILRKESVELVYEVFYEIHKVIQNLTYV